MYCIPTLEARAEIVQKLGLFFERFEDTKNSFLRLTDLYVTNVPNNVIITVKIYCTLFFQPV